MDLGPLPFIILAHGVPQLCFRQALRRARFLFLLLQQHHATLRHHLAHRVHVRPQLFGDRPQPGLVIGAHATANRDGGGIPGGIESRDPGFELAPLIQQTLDGRGAFGRRLRHPTPGRGGHVTQKIHTTGTVPNCRGAWPRPRRPG